MAPKKAEPTALAEAEEAAKEAGPVVKKVSPTTQSVHEGIIAAYGSHIASLTFPVWRAAITTPSQLWLRMLIIPVFAAAFTWDRSPLLAISAAAIALAVVPLLVGFFIRIQLSALTKKGLDNDLQPHTLAAHYSDDGHGHGSRFFYLPDPANPEHQALGGVGVAHRKGGQAELMYLAVRPDAEDKDALADALLAAAITHARKSGFAEMYIKINCAEKVLLAAVRRAGLGNEQLIVVNPWFHAFRLQLNLKKAR
ncbi:hypothetical protein TSOC_000253 [Tetrabaena socialis]|uniref:N-acetyltransferase domain-containing protein n=1 Tax=Tetrabaena socialis TaxID=47790 RepID=A0A2J8AJU7_9CHLO|nr:hypothetical protein TSOC_000253 [Tetrabaena socialis]|eukprot:PNH12794.1 hypothetical protein TSOC_000253 [Tetrabaena socialis]